MVKTSIVIQGPLSPVSLGNLAIYKKYGETIISGWTRDNQVLLETLPTHVKVVLQEQPDTKNVVNMLNIYLQTCSTLGGLSEATGDYVIKLRSDEAFSTLDPIMEAIEKFPDRVICTNIYFSQVFPLHISDHIIVAKRETMIKAFEILKKWLEEFPQRERCPEMAITRAFLSVFGEPRFDLDYMSERKNSPAECDQMIKHFYIVPCRDLSPMLIRAHHPHGGQRILFDKESLFDPKHQCLNHVGEIRETDDNPGFLSLANRRIEHKANRPQIEQPKSTKYDYLRRQKIFYNRKDLDLKDEVVGFYKENENHPYETLLLYQNQDVRCPLIQDCQDKVALDFGCGPGRMIKRMNKIFKRVDGVDISGLLLNCARQEVPESNFYESNGDDCGDAPDNYYDFIYSTLCLQHIPCHSIRTDILKSMKSKLKPRGSICVQLLMQRVIPLGHSGWMADSFHATEMNSGHDVYITPETQAIAIEEFGEIFTDVRYWLSSYFLGTQSQIFIYGKKSK